MGDLVTAELRPVFAGIFVLLVVATAATALLRWKYGRDNATLANVAFRVAAWWVIFGVLGGAIVAGRIAVIATFGVISFLALREFVSLTYSREGDHHALLAAFFVVTPLQYALVADAWYGLFTILIPVYAFTVLLVRVALSGQTSRYLERVASLQLALMLCVYSLSMAPALLDLDLTEYDGPHAGLLVFLVLITQLSDVAQYLFGKLFGRHAIAPTVSPNKTWEGFFGGMACSALLGVGLHSLTPFGPSVAGLIALGVALAGFGGGLVMSAVKRDRGVKDFGALIPGHGGVLDRVDSLVVAAPLFFHVTRYYFGV